MEKVDTSGGDNACWPWTSARNPAGYGVFNLHGRTRLAHRMVAHLRIGFLPKRLCVMHKCDNPGCVRPDHLFVGTHRDNAIDMMQKGRGTRLCGERHGNSKLTQAQVDEIRQSPKPQRALARQCGVTHSLIGKIRRGEIWKTPTKKPWLKPDLAWLAAPDLTDYCEGPL
jgi:hypothetical protein